jgi:ParB family transcriptional regulator, chromosome partitioning protein
MTATENKSSKESRMRKGGLGKGFNSLLGLGDEPKIDLPEVSHEDSSLGARVNDIEINLIDPNPHQPRRHFRAEDLQDLASSIRVDGIIQPILLSKDKKSNRFTLIAGERRWRSAQMAGLTTIPAIIKEHTPEEMLRVALIENIQRADLNVIEEALAYSSLMNEFGLTQEQCAQRVGKDRTTVTNTLRLLGLPNEVQQDIIETRLTMGHGRALLALPDTKLMLRARDFVVKKQLNVRQTEKLCKDFAKSPNKKPEQLSKSSPDLDYVAESLRGFLRTKVKVRGSGTRGKLEISYFSAAELERIIHTIGLKV